MGPTETPMSAGTGATDKTSYPQDASTTQIHDDIAQTRGQMDRTIDELGERLQPRHLFDSIVEWFRGDGENSQYVRGKAMSWGSSALGVIRDNPLPLALIGAGAAWMLLSGRKSDEPKMDYRRGPDGRLEVSPYDEQMHSGSYVDARTGEPYNEATYAADLGTQGEGQSEAGSSKLRSWTEFGKQKIGQASGAVGGAVSSAKDTAGGWMASAASTVKSAASTAASKVKDAVSSTASSAKDLASSAGSKVKEGASWAASSATGGLKSGATSIGGSASSAASQSKDWIGDSIIAYPLIAGFFALLGGALLGLILPRTRREDELMGEQADELKDRAIETGEELLERGKHAASATLEAARDEMKKQGLTPGELVESAKHMVGRTKEAAAEEGLTPTAIKDKAEKVYERVKDTASEELRGGKGGPDADPMKAVADEFDRVTPGEQNSY